MASVMIVDDDGDTREALTEILQETGVRVRCTPSGPEAIFELAREKPSLLLIDTWMPHRGGDEVLEWLEQRHEFDRLPVIAMTGDSHRLTHPRAVTVLRKPCDVDELLRLVRQFCSPQTPPTDRRLPKAG